MRRLASMPLAVASVLSWAAPLSASPSESEFGSRLVGKRVLHVGAHPDDESLFAPMMAEACRFEGATCHLVVAQEADSWGCLLTIGMKDRFECSRIRRIEAAASAANLNASLEFYGWREGMYNWTDAGVESNIDGLSREAGGRAVLVARFRRTFDAFRPEVVLAFDPRHGTTCHPNHRAVVTLMLEAIAQLPPDRQPEVWFDSDYAVPGAPPEIAAITDNFGIVRWPDDPTPVYWYDATVSLPDGRTGYDYLVDALRLNATQFNAIATGRVTPAPPPQQRRVPMVRLADIDPKQAGLCEGRAPSLLRRVESMSEAEIFSAFSGN